MLRACLALFLILLAPAVRAQDEVTYDQMRALAEGPFASLTQFLPITEPALAAPCDLTRPGQSHALLFLSLIHI